MRWRHRPIAIGVIGTITADRLSHCASGARPRAANGPAAALDGSWRLRLSACHQAALTVPVWPRWAWAWRTALASSPSTVRVVGRSMQASVMLWP